MAITSFLERDLNEIQGQMKSPLLGVYSKSKSVITNLVTGLTLQEGISFDAVLPEDIFYDQTTKRYRWKDTQRFVSLDSVLELQRKHLQKLERQLVSLSSQAKRLEIGTYADMAKILKSIHLTVASIAVGGFHQLTNSDLGTISAILKNQYYQGKDSDTGKQYGLKWLLKDIQANQNISEAQIAQRLQMFAESAKLTGYTLEQKRESSKGKTEMRRVLGRAEHCKECLRYSGMGWQVIGVLPLPTQKCSCRTRCKCKVLYR